MSTEDTAPRPTSLWLPCLGPTGLWVLRRQLVSCPSTQLRWNHTLSYFRFVSFFPNNLNVFKYLSYLKKNLPSLPFLTLYFHPVAPLPRPAARASPQPTPRPAPPFSGLCPQACVTTSVPSSHSRAPPRKCQNSGDALPLRFCGCGCLSPFPKAGLLSFKAVYATVHGSNPPSG